MIGIIIQLDCNWESSETQKSKTYDGDYQIKGEKMLKRKVIRKYKSKGEGSGEAIASMKRNGHQNISISSVFKNLERLNHIIQRN